MEPEKYRCFKKIRWKFRSNWSIKRIWIWRFLLDSYNFYIDMDS